MTWSANFQNSLESPSTVISYEVRFYRLPSTALPNSSGRLKETGRIAITDEEIEIVGVSVVPQTWGITFGGFAINITGDITPIKSGPFRKGNVASLHMSRNNLPFERVCIGQLRSVSGVRGQWRLEFVDVLTMLYSRVTLQANKSPFYYNAGDSTTVSSAFNISLDTRLYVANVSKFEKDSSENGIIKVESGGSTDFYEYGSINTGGGFLNITSNGNYPGDATLNTLPIGATVTNLARTKGRPDEVLHRTLISIDGNQTEGVFDTYPRSYGVNVRWGASIWDTIDANIHYLSILKASSSVDLEIDIVHDAPVTEGLRDLLSKLALMGVWPVWRHDKMSVRGCQQLKNAPIIALKMTDNDIIEILSHDIYARNQQLIYTLHTNKYRNASASATQSAGTTANLIPIGKNLERDFTDILERGANTLTMVSSISSRLKTYDFRNYEELVLRVTEKAAGLVAGDIVTLSSRFIYGFDEAKGKTYHGKKAMVIGCIWRPQQRSVTLSLAVGDQ